MEEAGEPIPVSVVTGFLGSGKTTLLSRLLRRPGMARTAVIVNEFGEVALDHEILATSSDENIAVLDSGCVCCSIRGELAETLRDLFGRRHREEIPAFERTVIETSGLTDPAPVLHTLMVDPAVAACFRLDGVITTVDAALAPGQLDEYGESLRQVAIADRLLLTKPDLADDAALEALEDRLARINPGAHRHRVLRGEIAPDLLFGAGPHDPADRMAGVRNWLREEAFFPEDADHDHGGRPDGGHREHAHDHGRHDHRFTSFSLRHDGAMSWNGWVGFLEALIAAQGGGLLRLKGLLNVTGLEAPVMVHGVQHVFHPPEILDAWPSDDHGSRLVFIGDGLSRRNIRRMFEAWIQAEDGSDAA